MVNPAAGGRLSLTGIGKIYEDPAGRSLTALDQFDLEIQAGEFVALVGPSGCGKSTLLRLIAGLEPVSAGTITLNDQIIVSPDHFKGLVFQDPTLYPWLTVRRNIALGLEIRGIANERHQEVQKYINLVGLAGFEDSFPQQLSGGMAQRTALARALINHPKVLLLDEPLGALDAFTRMQMQDEILRLWEARGTTVILVTHDIDEAIYLSDRLAIMTPRPGKIHQILEVGMGRPRARNHPDFFRLRSKILEILDFAKEYSLNYYL